MREEGSRSDTIRWLYCNWTWLVPDWGLFFPPALPLWWLYQIFQSYLGHLLPEEALEPGPLEPCFCSIRLWRPRVCGSLLCVVWTHRVSILPAPMADYHVLLEKLQSMFSYWGWLGRCQESILRLPGPMEQDPIPPAAMSLLRQWTWFQF